MSLNGGHSGAGVQNAAGGIDFIKGVYEMTVLPSASRGTTAGADIALPVANSNGSWLHLPINITAAGTGTLTVTIQGIDPVSGVKYTLLASAGLTAAGLTVLRVGPGLTAAANLVANDFVPRTISVHYVIATSAMTFSIGCILGAS